MVIGERLRAWRTHKALSLAEMEKRTGLVRYHISRLENGHALPTLETLTRFARAFEVPLFHLVYEEGEAFPPLDFPRGPRLANGPARLSKKELRVRQHFDRLISRLSQRDINLLFNLARKMARPHRPRAGD